MSANTAQLLLLARRHQQQVLAIRSRTEVALVAAWRRVVTDPTEQTASSWSTVAVPVLQAAELAAAAAGLAYISMYVQAAGATPLASELTAAGFTEPRGVRIDELLHRPIIAMRTALSESRPLTEALTSGQQQLAQIATTDPMLSYRAATSAAMTEQPSVRGYRRVPDGKACKFCLLAATQRYHDADLMPLHPACGCTVAPIIGAKDPGQIIDRDTLERLRADGVIDDITRRRRAQAQRDISASADRDKARASYWRSEAEHAPDAAARKRYLDRAEKWDLRARQKLNELPPPVDAQRLFDEIIANPRKFTTVHQHGELGPVLYEPRHHFDAA